ncbi:helix-turn-helix domain-containing protein [Nocardia niigatensis]|uniref:helix-turn-helix domain-containing protein n=1 Tax=Nocardia niigatensis TaxID=209249 RepID=UPI0002FBBC5A|nr:helix-turn-helix transcriptional regulator [Nocardia niigatensis]
MSGYSRWRDIREEFVERAGGEEAVAAGKEELLAEIRRSRGMTQQQLAERMGVTKGRITQIEQGSIAGCELLVRYAAALGGRLHQSIHFDDGEISAIA